VPSFFLVFIALLRELLDRTVYVMETISTNVSVLLAFFCAARAVVL